MKIRELFCEHFHEDSKVYLIESQGFIYLPAMLNVLILSAKAAQNPGGKSLLIIFLEGVIFPLYIVFRYQLNFSTSVMIYGNRFQSSPGGPEVTSSRTRSHRERIWLTSQDEEHHVFRRERASNRSSILHHDHQLEGLG